LLKASTKYFVREHTQSWRRCQIAAEINKYKGSTEVKVFKRVEITTVVINYEDNNKRIGDLRNRIRRLKRNRAYILQLVSEFRIGNKLAQFWNTP